MHNTESLGDDVGSFGRHQDFVVLATFGFRRNLAEDGDVKGFLDVAFTTKFSVEEVEAKHDDSRDSQAEHQTDEGKHHQVGRHLGTCCAFHHLGVGHGDGLREGVLFAFAEEIDVELLLHLLLTFHLGDRLGLRRHLLQLTLRLPLFVFGRLKHDFGRTEQVVDRLDDGFAGSLHLTPALTQGGVVFARLHTKLLVVEHLLVVIRNHALYGGVFDTDIGRYQLVVLAGVIDVVAHIVDHLDLCGEADDLFVVAQVGLEHGAASGAEVGYAGLLVDLFHLVVHHAQLAAEKRDTLGDELLGHVCHLVFVVHRVLIIGADEGVQNLFGAQLVGVGVDKVKDGGHLVGTRHGEALNHALGQIVGGEVGKGEGGAFVLFRHVEFGAVDAESEVLVYRNDLIVHGLFLLAMYPVFVYLSNGVGVALVVLGGHGEADVDVRPFGMPIVDAELKWGIFVVGGLVEKTVSTTLGFQPQTMDDVHHHRCRTEDVHLVLETHAALGKAHVGEDGFHALSHVVRLLVVAHQDGGALLVGLGFGLIDDSRYQQAGHDGDDEPIPIVENEEDKISYGDGVFGLVLRPS